MIICAIYDKKAKTYDTPLIMPNAAIATRAFANQCNQDGPIKQFAEDYELHMLGSFENNIVKVTYKDLMPKAEVIKNYELKQEHQILAQGVVFVSPKENVHDNSETKKK
jgi:hypothetical protein